MKSLFERVSKAKIWFTIGLTLHFVWSWQNSYLFIPVPVHYSLSITASLMSICLNSCINTLQTPTLILLNLKRHFR